MTCQSLRLTSVGLSSIAVVLAHRRKVLRLDSRINGCLSLPNKEYRLSTSGFSICYLTTYSSTLVHHVMVRTSGMMQNGYAYDVCIIYLDQLFLHKILTMARGIENDSNPFYGTIYFYNCYSRNSLLTEYLFIMVIMLQNIRKLPYNNYRRR